MDDEADFAPDLKAIKRLIDEQCCAPSWLWLVGALRTDNKLYSKMKVISEIGYQI